MEERSEFRALDQLIDGKRDTLPLDWPIELKDGQMVSVEAILRSGRKYHCGTCWDPRRPEYLSGRIHADGCRISTRAHPAASPISSARTKRGPNSPPTCRPRVGSRPLSLLPRRALSGTSSEKSWRTIGRDGRIFR